ncbi:ATP-binding protein [Halarcobacter mediterraneus]|nr:ATP-binding protein [Halarcobacter mediterraneus]
MNKKIIFKFAMIYSLLSFLLLFLFYSNYKKTTEEYLQKKTTKHYLNYKSIYNRYKQIANIVFETEINTNEILSLYKNAYTSNKTQKMLIRGKLYNLLKDKYKQLKVYNLKQLHFHLPNNESFLRMHRPNIFGDNLSNIRLTVSIANKTKKYTHGFEEGRIFNGFRFVYPLNYNNIHIGSVEISFSVLALIDSIKENYDTNSNFLIRKDIVDKKVFKEEKSNYLQSPNKDFYFEKSVYNKYKPLSVHKDSVDYTNKILEGNSFSTFIEELNLIKTVIPIKNPISNQVVAALCICEEDFFIKDAKRNFFIFSSFSIIALTLIFYLFFMQKIANEKLKKTNKNLDRRIQLELKRNRKKDASILNQSKMASLAELLNNLAHQWRQPLNIISTSSSGLSLHKEMNNLDDKTFEMLTSSINEQTQFLSKTLDEFREFLNDTEEEKKTVIVQDRVNNALKIIEKTFEYEKIDIIKKFHEEDLYININVGDLIQVLLNVLNNSKEALIKNNKTSKKEVKIRIKKIIENKVLITIEDNAGGVKEEYKDKIFDPYFTTKHESIGTGISLYLCYELITTQCNGKIYFKNKKEGAKFYIELPLKEQKL